MNEAALELAAVTCRRGGRTLFDGLDLLLRSGDAAIVRGPNGVGKTSLLRVAAGLLRPEGGRVRSTGAIGWLGDGAALDAQLPLAQALYFWARLDGRGEGAVTAAMHALAIVQLASVPVRMLSSGQRRRAAIARVLASGAALWLLDEPSNGLDDAAVAGLTVAITAHRASGGIAMVATHQALDLPAAIDVALGG